MTLHCSVGEAEWAREQDGVRFTAHDGGSIVAVHVTRAGLAALAAKDQSEISAQEGMELFRAHADRISVIARQSYAREPRAILIIDYAEIETVR